MSRARYSKKTLLKAVDEYKSGSSSTDIAKKYGIPGSTIRNHKINPNLRTGSGRPPLLNNDQEQYLVAMVKNLEIVGLRLTKALIMRLSSDYINSVTGKNVEVGRKWLGLFLNRWNSELTVSKEETMRTGRRSGFNEDARCRWFERLNRVMMNKNLISRPQAIYNCSESGFDKKTPSELQIVYHQTNSFSGTADESSTTDFVTNIICCSAAGEILPPFVVYAEKGLNSHWTCGGPDGSSFHLSPTGFITKSLFVEWFKCFVDYTQTISKPILLIMDNHPCFISIEIVEMARQNHICFLFFPDHCQDALKPLNTMISSTTKEFWKHIVNNYFFETSQNTIQRMDVPFLLKQLYDSAFTAEEVRNVFIRTGVVSFDSNSVREDLVQQQLQPAGKSDQLLLQASPVHVPTSSLSYIEAPSNLLNDPIVQNNGNSTCAYIFEPIDSVFELMMSPLALVNTDDSDSVKQQDDGRGILEQESWIDWKIVEEDYIHFIESHQHLIESDFFNTVEDDQNRTYAKLIPVNLPITAPQLQDFQSNGFTQEEKYGKEIVPDTRSCEMKELANRSLTRKGSIGVRISLGDSSNRSSLPNDNNLHRNKQNVSEEASEAITFFQPISPLVTTIPSLTGAYAINT